MGKDRFEDGPRKSVSGRHAKGRAKSGRKPRRDNDGLVTIYGIHSVDAALKNPQREIVGFWATKNAAQRLSGGMASRGIAPEPATPQELDRLLGEEAVHQGALLKTQPLPQLDIEDLPQEGLCLALDQVTDPHNVGAILRSAAVFGASALIMTERNSPALSGVLAKTASGGLEHVPVILVTNLSRALTQLGEHGFQRIGLDGEGEAEISKDLKSEKTLLVLGAEGKGLRRLTREHCDILCRIPTAQAMASLNVSNAAAVALFALRES